jgi:SAM-dependent methyltransferase
MNIFSRQPTKEQHGVKEYATTDFYWGIVPRDEMEAFLRLCSEKGFNNAEKEFTFSGRFDYAHEVSRADFHFLLPLSEDATILDLGSGYGNVTMPLARYYKKIVAADASRPLLEFSSFRAQAEGLKNIEYVHIDPLEHCNLPFQPKSFDAIMLNGVLEWVGAGTTEGDPQELQEKLLTHLQALLKDDGFLYIAIENRMFPGWLRRDPHSKLKWTTIMPRVIANWYAEVNGQDFGYRTYIYSSVGYRRMLRRNGFNASKFYYPYTTYRSPDYIYSNDKPVETFLFKGYLKNIFTKKWNTFLQWARRLGLQYFFLSSFLIIASRNKDQTFVPGLITMLKNAGIKNVEMTDSVLKVKGKGSADTHAYFALFHENTSKPYMAVKALRAPTNQKQRVEQVPLNAIDL